MRNDPALRLSGQVFFCSAALSFFTPFCQDLRVFWLLSLLTLAAALIAFPLSRFLPRLLLGLVPALALLLPISSWLSFGAAALMALYVAILLASGRFSPEPWVYRKEAVWTLALSGLMMIVCFASTHSSVETLYLLMCAVFLVLLTLQSLHVSASMGPRWQAGTVGSLLLILAVGVLLGLGLWATLPLLRQIGFYISTVFMNIVFLAIALFTKGFSSLMNLFSHEEQIDETADELPTLYYRNPDAATVPVTSSERPHTDPLQFDIPWEELLTAFVLIALILFAIYFIRKGGLRRLQARVVTFANLNQTPEKRQKRGKQKPAPTTNREKLREVYAQYLAYLRTQNVAFRKSDTTAEISEASSELFVENDAFLRALYRKARYSTAQITDEELLAAGEALNQLISDENLNAQQHRAQNPPYGSS